MVLAEVDSGDDLTDSDLDSESTDNESELTDVTMPMQYCVKYQFWNNSDHEAKGTIIFFN